jgi:hypothetical protein
MNNIDFPKGMLRGILYAALALTAALYSSSAHANTITFDTASGATVGGQAVNGGATFTTGTDTLSITLQNFQNDPTSVIQALSGLSFALSTGQTVGTLTSSSGMERTIASNGSYTDGATVATGWTLSPGFTLNVLGAPIGPAHTLVGGPNGSNLYASANGSIGGNGPHNPFLAGPITFTLNIPGVTFDSSVNNVVFRFGTTGGDTSPGVGRTPSSVPDAGTTLILLGIACVGIEGLRRKLRG